MKKLFLPMAYCAISLFSSCESKTYLFTTHSTDGKTRADNEYIFENDTLKITYNFWKDRGNMSFLIYNKLSIPVFVDWQKSSLILDGTSFTYNNFENEGRFTIIPPHTRILNQLPSQVIYLSDKMPVNISLEFGNFITYTTKESIENEAFVINSFGVTEIKKISPMSLKKHRNPKNFYYTYKPQHKNL